MDAIVVLEAEVWTDCERNAGSRRRSKEGTRESIATDMGLAAETVKNHAQNLIGKTGDAGLASAGNRLLRQMVGGAATG